MAVISREMCYIPGLFDIVMYPYMTHKCRYHDNLITNTLISVDCKPSVQQMNIVS